jgi:hypothetical protein
MPNIKLFGLRVIRQIKRRLLKGEKSTTIAEDYGVSSGHIRKVRLGLYQPNHPNARWGSVKLSEAEEAYLDTLRNKDNK